jgi:beta-galactosidase
VDTAVEETAFAADLARGWAGRRPWLLMEQAPNLIYAGGRMVPKPPGTMARLSLSHIARGSAGVMFFQWRAPRGGSEMFHSAMVPHAGPSTRTFAEVRALGATIAGLPVTDAPVVADLALIWDPECWWALQGSGLPGEFDYLAAVRGWHAAALRLGLTVDVLSPRGDPRPYGLVLAPALFIVGESTAAILESYVEGGGSLVVGPFSGVVDPDHRVWPNGYPGPLTDLLGVRVSELHPLDHVGLSRFGTGHRWAEKMELVTASAQSGYGDGPLAGEPAVTRRGRAWYVSTCLTDPAEMLALLCAEAGIVAPEGAGNGVEVVRRADGTVFVIDDRRFEVSRLNT